MQHLGHHGASQRGQTLRSDQPTLEDALRTMREQGESTHRLIEEMRDLLAILAQRAERRDVVRLNVILGAYGPWTFRANGFRHSRIRLGTAASVTVEEAGISASISMAAGWNTLDALDGAVLSAAAATPVTIEWTDDLS